MGGEIRTLLYVGGLDAAVTRSALRSAFLTFGELKNVEIPVDRVTGAHRGFGFVEFEEAGDAEQAIANMHFAELYGRTLIVNYARSGAAGETGPFSLAQAGLSAAIAAPPAAAPAAAAAAADV